MRLKPWQGKSLYFADFQRNGQAGSMIEARESAEDQSVQVPVGSSSLSHPRAERHGLTYLLSRVLS